MKKNRKRGKPMSEEMPTIEYATRPITVNGKEVTTSELAWFGRMVIVALSQGEKIDKEFVKRFVRTKILIYTNPENVDFEVEGEVNQ